MEPVSGGWLLLLGLALALVLVGAAYGLGRRWPAPPAVDAVEAPDHAIWFADTAVEPHTSSAPR